MHDEAPSADSRSAREDRQLNTAPSPTPSSPEVSPSVDDPSVKSGTLSGLSDVARGKQKATEEEVQMWNVEEETAKKTDRRTAERRDTAGSHLNPSRKRMARLSAISRFVSDLSRWKKRRRKSEN
jgi:hypothetical protein